MRMTTPWRLGLVLHLGLGACAPPPVPPDLPTDAGAPADAPGSQPPSGAAQPAHAAANDPWQEALSGAQRSAENRARDAARHPRETLEFFGVTPTSTVVEINPGEGWYTEILGPYLRDAGRLIITVADPQGPAAYYGTQASVGLLARIEAAPEVFGSVTSVIEPLEVTLKPTGEVESVVHKPFALAPAGTVDVILTFRNSHGWFNRGAIEQVYAAAFTALKPGGVFGVVQHRANPGADAAASAKMGYLPEATVVAVAQKVGFVLADKAEINANPKDTKDYAHGVWTLPPSYRLGDEDRAKYEAIGESDRMTLKFVKPK